VHILTAVETLYPGRLQFSVSRGRYTFDLVWGTDAVRKAVTKGERADQIVARWTKELQRFHTMRQRYLIYPRGGAAAAR